MRTPFRSSLPIAIFLLALKPAQAQSDFQVAVTPNPANIPLKQTVQFTATATSNSAAPGYSMVFLVRRNGFQAATQRIDNLNFTANQPITETFNWTVPPNAKPGAYVVTVAIEKYGGNYGSSSASFSVQGTLAKASLHYAAGSNAAGSFAPAAADGFNMADVSSLDTLNALPSGVVGLVWLGLCNGADSNFITTVTPFIGNSKLYGFYLMDEPDPTGQYAPLCPAANLKAESDWIHANVPNAKTFIVLMNLGSDTNPTYTNTYNPENTGLDLFGLDPYPCKAEFNGCNFNVIPEALTAAQAAGIPLNSIIPVYQAFGGGGYAAWLVPTQAQEVLSTWQYLLPTPAFDYVYAWGSQDGDQALSTLPDLQPTFLRWNTTP